MRIPDSFILPIIASAFLALAGWIYTTGNRVTALETRQPTIEENLKVIREDVREIRQWVVPNAPVGP
jgi:hypothetical protein